MEDAVKGIGADVAIISAESGQNVRSYHSESNKDLGLMGRRFVSLDAFVSNLKIGPLNQLVAVKKSGVEMSTRHGQLASIVAANTLDKALLAESLAKDLIQ